MAKRRRKPKIYILISPTLASHGEFKICSFDGDKRTWYKRSYCLGYPAVVDRAPEINSLGRAIHASDTRASARPKKGQHLSALGLELRGVSVRVGVSGEH